MKILIIEDESPAARQLGKLVRTLRPAANILAVLDSIDSAVQWLQQPNRPDLIFMDIQLADGLSFDIFHAVEVQTPVIFTTAYDQFTLRAFKVNSIDYLLKPIEPEELEQALQKFDRVYKTKPAIYDQNLIQNLVQTLSNPSFKERFLVKAGQQLSYIRVEEIRFFYSEDGLIFTQTDRGRKHNIDYTLDQLTELLDPVRFFRLNRKIISSIDAICRISPYFNSRLIVELQPGPDFDVIVSRDRVTQFKKWLDR
jgi:DNA-binding LytR/AlgR family response regulator